MLSRCGADAFFAKRKGMRGLEQERDNLRNMLEALATHFRLPIRVVQRMVSRLMLVMRQTPIDGYMAPELTAFLIFLRTRNEPLLRAFASGSMQVNTLMTEVAKMQPGGAAFIDTDDGFILEAILLASHGHENYVQSIVRQIEGLSIKKEGELSPEQLRLTKLGRFLGVAMRRRYGVDTLIERIDLVTTNLEKDR